MNDNENNINGKSKIILNDKLHRKKTKKKYL